MSGYLFIYLSIAYFLRWFSERLFFVLHLASCILASHRICSFVLHFTLSLRSVE